MARSRIAIAALLAALLAGSACDVARPILGDGSAVSACTTCHGDASRLADDPLVRAAPPADVGGRAPGAHLAHLRGGAFRGPIACGECHDVPTTAAHLDGVVEVPLGGALARARGAAPSWTDPTCSSVYCHGATLADGPGTTPAWTAAGTLGCTSCHGAPPRSHDPSATSCSLCHPGTVKPDGTIDVANKLHIDGAVEVNQAHPDGWAAREQHGYAANATGLARCKSCHGADLNGGTGPSCSGCHDGAGQPGWATRCTFCHGDRASGRASPPVDTQGQSDAARVSVGAHAAHVTTTITTPLACGECHPARSGSVVDDPAHVDGDGVAEVVFGALARTGGAAATYARTGATGPTCSSVYCHGAFTGGAQASPGWTSTAQATCGSCHAAQPSGGRHGDHSRYACSECHGHAGSGATHLNGRKDVPFSPAAPGAAWNASTGSCGSFSCHGESHGTSRTW